MPLSTILQLYRGGQFFWWRKPLTCQILSHNVALSTPGLNRIRTDNFSDDRHWLHR